MLQLKLARTDRKPLPDWSRHTQSQFGSGRVRGNRGFLTAEIPAPFPESDPCSVSIPTRGSENGLGKGLGFYQKSVKPFLSPTCVRFHELCLNKHETLEQILLW